MARKPTALPPTVCLVCGGPAPRRSHGQVRATCSPECLRAKKAANARAQHIDARLMHKPNAITLLRRRLGKRGYAAHMSAMQRARLDKARGVSR